MISENPISLFMLSKNGMCLLTGCHMALLWTCPGWQLIISLREHLHALPLGELTENHRIFIFKVGHHKCTLKNCWEFTWFIYCDVLIFIYNYMCQHTRACWWVWRHADNLLFSFHFLVLKTTMLLFAFINSSYLVIPLLTFVNIIINIQIKMQISYL